MIGFLRRRRSGLHARSRGDIDGWFERMDITGLLDQTPPARPRVLRPWKPRAVPDAPAPAPWRAPDDTVVDGLLGFALRCLTCDLASLDAVRASYAQHIDRQAARLAARAQADAAWLAAVQTIPAGYDNEALIVPFGCIA